MKEFPKLLNTNNFENFNKLQVHRWLCYARDEVYEFLIKQDDESIVKDYFDFTTFFQKFDIKKEEHKVYIINSIASELKDKNWVLGVVFGGVGLVITHSDEMLEKSIWHSCLDFTKL